MVSVARAWVVEKKFRGTVQNLCEAFFNQKMIDVVLISSANKAAGARCLEFGGRQMPEATFKEVLYWIISPEKFSRSALSKIGFPKSLLYISELTSIFPLRPLLTGNIGTENYKNIEFLSLPSIGEKFDNFWLKMRAKYPDRLLAMRDAKTLKWYFGLNANNETTKFLAYFDNGELLGYAVVIREDVSKINLRRLSIADFVVLGDDQVIVGNLLIAAYAEAKAQKCHVLELTGLPPFIRNLALKLKPFRRNMPIFPFYFKALTPNLADHLSCASSWYATSYDGDSAIF